MNSGNTIPKSFNKSSETKPSNPFCLFSTKNTSCTFSNKLVFDKSCSGFGEKGSGFGKKNESFDKKNESFDVKNECFGKNSESFDKKKECFDKNNTNSSNKRAALAPIYYPIYFYNHLIINNYDDN